MTTVGCLTAMIYSVPFISAHRGGSVVVGERAADRYRRAVELGVDYVEFDVRRTLDGVLVVFHDPCTASGRQIAKLAWNDLIEELGAEAMSFEELLDVAAGKVGLHLDLKETGFEALVVGTVLERSPHDMLVVTSEVAVVAEVKREFPHLRAGLSLGEDLDGKPPWVKLRVRFGGALPKRRLEACHADFVAVHRHLASLNVLRYCKSIGMPAWVWTVDEEPEMARFMADPRVTALITDRPEIALRLKKTSDRASQMNH